MAQIHLYMGQAEQAQEFAGQAIAAINAAPRTGGYIDSFELWVQALAYAMTGQPGLAMEAIEEAASLAPESKDLMFGTFVSQGRAQVLGMIGRRDEALAEIERLLNHPYPLNRWRLYLDPRWDFFRDDPRFNELIRPEGAPEAGP